MSYKWSNNPLSTLFDQVYNPILKFVNSDLNSVRYNVYLSCYAVHILYKTNIKDKTSLRQIYDNAVTYGRFTTNLRQNTIYKKIVQESYGKVTRKRTAAH